MSFRGVPPVAWRPEAWITTNDLDRSATTHHTVDLRRALEPLRDRRLERMLDVGCGFGGLARVVGDYLGVDEVHGIDNDPIVEAEAESKGIVFVGADAGRALPFPDQHFDFVMSLGMMDYLPTFDPLIREFRRVLSSDGYVLVALPNLVSWHNRLAVVLGYQPRDVEVSSEALVGQMPWYSQEPPTGHIHTTTVSAFEALMLHHQFATERLSAGIPSGRPLPLAARAIDRLLSRRLTLARRFFYVGRKLPST